MRKQIIVFVLGLVSGVGWSQKMVIGSKVPVWQSEVTWLSSVPEQGRALLIDFYDPGNPSCVRFFPRYEQIQGQWGGEVDIVLVVRQGVDVDQLSFGESVPFAIAYDQDGKMYEQFGVQYLPYSVLVDGAGALFWQGNLGNLSEETLERVQYIR